MDPSYDRIGATYTATRRPDPRIRDAIWAAIGDAETVVNVGAGAGSYEPPQTVLAVEPSARMIAQRPPGSAPVVQATAEAIPLPDGACDVAMASLTMHHWADQQKGLAEMRRVARRLVLFTFDVAYMDAFWLVRDYVPEIAELDRSRFPPIEQIAEWMGGAVREVVVPVPSDCEDGFMCAFWQRPEMYLDPRVRAGISTLAVMPDAVITRLVIQLSDDLETGRWLERNEDILELDELDLGYRILY